jgi:DNA processing protein
MYFKGKRMTSLSGRKVYTYTLLELLGPLNDVEEKYAPKKLYVAGDLPIPLPKPRSAVIGSRKASPKALEDARIITSALVQNGIIIVSGLARGIDTVAVLGTLLDKYYPKENTPLQNFIMNNHLAVSQFPTGHPIQPRNFVIRNRTMALISDISIIVEAGDSSGSLHQGWEALRLGRPLFIWKSIVDDGSLSWPKKMIDYGAMVLTEPDEVLEYLPSNQGILKLIQ